MISVHSLLVVSILFWTCGCANSGNVAGNNGRKNAKPAATTSDSDESLGNDAEKTDDSDSGGNVTKEESSVKKTYDDSESSSPQDISGAFLVCAQVEPPAATSDSASSYFGCSMTLDDKNLFDYSAFDVAWEVRDTAGFKVEAEQIDGPNNSFIQRVFKVTTTALGGVKTILARLSNKKNSADAIDVKGELEKGKIYPYPTENDVETRKTCPVCPQQ